MTDGQTLGAAIEMSLVAPAVYAGMAGFKPQLCSSSASA